MAAPFRLSGSRFALLAGVLALTGLRADEPAKSPPKAPLAGRSIDPAKLPPNAVIIVTDNPRDALQHVDAVVLTPEEYKKLLDAAEQAKRLAVPDQPEPPAVCTLRGRIEARGATEVATVRAEFRLRTTVPRAIVLLGLQKGKPVAATIDGGKLAVLVPLKDDDGFGLQVNAPGEHHVVVDLEVPLASRGSRGGERGVELGLPGAAITTVERFELPAGVTRVRLAGRAVPPRHLASGTAKAPAALLGPAQKLELTWEVPTAKGQPFVTVDGRYDVRVEDRSVATHARLILKVQGSAVGRWEINAPPAAEFTVEGTAPEAAPRFDKPRDKTKPWIVRRDPSTDDLILDVSVRTDYEVGKPVAVPIFFVQGADQHRGVISVGGPPHLRLTYKPADHVTRRESPDDAGPDAVFAYSRLAESESPLEIEVQAARGEVETQVSHQLTLAERGWRWQGKVDVRPVRTEVAAVDFEIPAGWEDLRSASAELVEGIAPAPSAPGSRPIVRVQLAAGRRKPFVFTLEAHYPVSALAGSVSLPLPRPHGTRDRGGQIAATVPAGLDLRGGFHEWDGEQHGDWERPLSPPARGGPGLVATVERAPARLELAWRAPRADVLVTSTADIQLADRQATVRHRWHVPAGPASPRQFVARGPSSLTGRVRVIDGATLASTGPGEWSVQLTAPAGREATMTLAYSFALPSGANRPAVPVPLLWFEPCPRCETNVRLWAGATPAGMLHPALAEGPWTEVPPRAAADRGTLPALSLHGGGTHLPLALNLTESGAGPGTGLVIDKVWVQAVVDADGQQAYRTRCLIRPLQTHYLDVELPGPPSIVRFAAFLDGKQIPPAPADGPGGRFVRLRIDPTEPTPGPRQVELVHVLPPAPESRWQITLTPPRLRGPAFVGPVRWQVGLATDHLLMSGDDFAAFHWRWSWDRGIFAPRPAWTDGDLRQWFGLEPRSAVDGADVLAVLPTSVVGWQPSLEPLTFLSIPTSIALLFGSLAVVLIGLGALHVGMVWRVVGGVALAIALAWLAMSRPQTLAIVLYSIQPGVVVLAAIGLVLWVAKRRYQRRVLFLPSFSRSAAGMQRQGRAAAAGAESSLGHNGAATGRGRREPSTVDAPAMEPGLPTGDW